MAFTVIQTWTLSALGGFRAGSVPKNTSASRATLVPQYKSFGFRNGLIY